MFMETTLAAGTVVYHGTNVADFDEECDRLDGPAWVTTSFEVAKYFAKRHQSHDGNPRIVEYRLDKQVALPRIESERAMAILAEENSLVLSGVEDIRDSVERSSLPGWILPFNYPNGDDILLVDTSVLEYVKTHALTVPAPPASLWKRIDAVKVELRNAVPAIKDGTNYSLCVSYGKVHVLCASVYEDSIREKFEAASIPLETLNTFA